MSARLIIGNYNYSSWSLRAWLAATMSGLEFEVLRLPLDTPEFAKKIQDLSPSRCVPALQHGALTIWDSLAICEYLAESFPEAELWPAEIGERARARSVAAEMHSGFASLRANMPMNCRAMGRRVEIDDRLRADISRIEEIWSECLRRSGGPFLFGDFSIADAMYAPVVLRFETYGVSQPKALHAFRAHLLGLPAMQVWLSRAQAETEVIEAEEAGL